MIDHQQRAARPQRGVERSERLCSGPRRHRPEVEVVQVLHGDDCVERFGKRRRRDRPAQRGDVGAPGDGGILLLAVGRAEGNELVGLECVDMALGPDGAREDPRPIAAAHDVIADLLAFLDLSERQQIGRESRGVSLAVRCRPLRIGEGGCEVGFGWRRLGSHGRRADKSHAEAQRKQDTHGRFSLVAR